MTLTALGWKNKKETAERTCSCGTWKQHWLNHSVETWPRFCSVNDCRNEPTLGAHVINVDVTGEKIVPMCASCNNLSGSFNLSDVWVVSANKSETCDKYYRKFKFIMQDSCNK